MAETLFAEVRYDLHSLVKFIELGEIGLPDLQRPFVWKNAKIRDLLDSMYRGFPVGYLLFWQNAVTDGARPIGADSKQKVPRLLIVDGQQRLTSLYAVIKGIEVIRENYERERIGIAFSPLQEKFEVADAAVRKDPSFIENISVLWNEKTDLFDVVENHLGKLGQSRSVEDEEKKRIRKAITRVHSLLTYPFTALELAASIDEEQVSEVFVRINSKGKPLNQADFILTLMSVFWDKGRSQLEHFSRDARKAGDKKSPYNHFLEPSPDQLLRASVGLGFKRARLQYVYSILRGKDLDTGEFSNERREEQFEVLKNAQERVLRLQYWHDFFNTVREAGYRSTSMITSDTTLVYSYVLYLIGRTEYKVDEFDLRRAIARWFFMATLTGRYTGSPESAMEFDLARLRQISDADAFVAMLDRVCDDTLTPDYWSITLPNELATSAARSPSLFAYMASLVLLDARVLFSKQKVADLLDPSIKGERSAIERHHLFPKAYLKKKGIEELRDTNQIANYALVEWGDNNKISESAPNQYVPKLAGRFKGTELRDMHVWHALPDGWETMDYPTFLQSRRELMAEVIRDGYEKLAPKKGRKIGATEVSVPELILSGETPTLEFKSTLSRNLHTREADDKMEFGVLKTIVGFLNAGGGTLIIGVADDGSPVGIEQDVFKNEDKMLLRLGQLIKDRIGSQYTMYMHFHFSDYQNVRVLKVECSPARSPVYLKDGAAERFMIRAGNSTEELAGKKAQEFIQQRFHS
jgi:hypothetical protein